MTAPFSKTFGQIIEEARRIVMPDPPMTVQLVNSVDAGTGTLQLNSASQMFQSVRSGTLLCVDLEVFFVLADPNPGNGVTPVAPGYMGSAEASHTAGALVEIKPRFNRWEVSQAVNEELVGLASPSCGLGQIATTIATWIPTFQGYDLGGGTNPVTGDDVPFDPLNSRVLEASFRIAPPIRTYPLMRRGQYRVIRNQSPSQSDFPSGCGIIYYKSGYPGFPVTVQYTAPYAPLVNLTDDLLQVGGVPVSQQDIVYMGTVLRIAPDREIARNATDAQPDPRKAPEVPPGAMAHAADSIAQRYQTRLNREASYQKQAYPHAEFF